MDISEFSCTQVKWLPSWRIISSRFPPIDLFERVANEEDFETVIEIEQLTNPRLREELNNISLVPKKERKFGPGTSYIMSAFTNLKPSRFSNGSFGVYYASKTLETAVLETKYHKQNFLRTF